MGTLITNESKENQLMNSVTLSTPDKELSKCLNSFRKILLKLNENEDQPILNVQKQQKKLSLLNMQN